MRLDVPHLGIVDHFAHEHPAVFVEGNCDGIAHLGLVGGELQLEAGFDLPRRNRVFRLDRRVVRQVLRRIEGHGGFRLAVGLPVGVAKLNLIGGEDPASETSKNTTEDSFHSQEGGGCGFGHDGGAQASDNERPIVGQEPTTKPAVRLENKPMMIVCQILSKRRRNDSSRSCAGQPDRIGGKFPVGTAKNTEAAPF